MSNEITENLGENQGSEILRRLDLLTAQAASLTAQVGAMDKRIDALDAKVDARLRETRPIWESVDARLADLQRDARNIDRKLDVPTKDVVQVRAGQRCLEDRFEKLEHP